MKTQTAPSPALERNHVEPEHGDLLCIRCGPVEWGFSGDRFMSRNGDRITAKQQFSNGSIRTMERDKSEFRVLRGTRLYHIA
jgi:hypothetical protein